MTQDEVKYLNQKVGRFLSRNRKRLRLTIEEVSTKLKSISPEELKKVENGESSVKCRTLYELLYKLYSPTEKEVIYFCCLLQKKPRKTNSRSSPS